MTADHNDDATRRPALRYVQVDVTFDPDLTFPHHPGEKGSRIIWQGHEYMPVAEVDDTRDLHPCHSPADPLF